MKSSNYVAKLRNGYVTGYTYEQTDKAIILIIRNHGYHGDHP